MVIDTGRASLQEVARAVEAARESGAQDILLQHSPDGHPALPEAHNLRILQAYETCFGLPTGLSDHYVGVEMLYVAIALGACVIEKGLYFDEYELDEDGAFARSGDGLVMLRANGPLELTRSGPSAEVELRLQGRRARWIVRITDRAEADSLAAMRRRFGELAVIEMADGTRTITDPTYGRVIFGADGIVEAEGRRLDPGDWTIQGEATTFGA